MVVAGGAEAEGAPEAGISAVDAGGAVDLAASAAGAAADEAAGVPNRLMGARVPGPLAGGAVDAGAGVAAAKLKPAVQEGGMMIVNALQDLGIVGSTAQVSIEPWTDKDSG